MGYDSFVNVIFVEAPSFTAARDEYFEDDDVFRHFQDDLAKDPEAGAVLPRTHGGRKVRWGRPGEGKRGGLRVIYGYWKRYAHILLLAVYEKSRKEDLDPAEERMIATLMREYEKSIKEKWRDAK